MKKLNNNLAKSALTFKNMTDNLLPIESDFDKMVAKLKPKKKEDE